MKENEGENEAEAETKKSPRTEVNENPPQSSIIRLLVAPINYYETKASSVSKPLAPSVFLDQNYKFLAIVGVFAALVVYFSQLSDTPSRPIIVGMIGGAIMFGIALIVVLHHTLIALAQSVMYRSVRHLILYIHILISLIFIAIAMMTFFGRYQTAVFVVFDALLAIVFVGVYALFAWYGTIVVPLPIKLDPMVEWIFRNSFVIGPAIVFILIIFWEPFSYVRINLPILSELYTTINAVDSVFITVIEIFLVLTLSSIAVAAISVISQLIIDVISVIRSRVK